jgi:hypothetical protein
MNKIFVYRKAIDKMPPKTEIWTNEKENRLIFEVEIRPMLWDVSCEAYKRADLKYNQWHQIAQMLGPLFNGNNIFILIFYYIY